NGSPSRSRGRASRRDFIRRRLGCGARRGEGNRARHHRDCFSRRGREVPDGRVLERECLTGCCLSRMPSHERSTSTESRSIHTNAAARWWGGMAATVPVPNTTEEGPRLRFLVRPSDYGLAERRAAELGGELLGFYHSHPDHPAIPSQYDLDHAWPTFAYVIASIVDGAVRDTTVWWL